MEMSSTAFVPNNNLIEQKVMFMGWYDGFDMLAFV